MAPSADNANGGTNDAQKRISELDQACVYKSETGVTSDTFV